MKTYNDPKDFKKEYHEIYVSAVKDAKKKGCEVEDGNFMDAFVTDVADGKEISIEFAWNDAEGENCRYSCEIKTDKSKKLISLKSKVDKAWS